MVEGSFEGLFLTFARAIGIVVIVGAAGAFVGHLARVLPDRLSRYGPHRS